ncbi:MAG: hypothetical protein LBF27_30205 [Sphingobacterium sp.]|nr:hypothetical protein [Sphingobacterium sp.]
MKYFLTTLFFKLWITLCMAQGISVSPSRIFFKGGAGQTVSQTITLNNATSTEFNFIASLKDWDRDSLGNKRYYPAGQRKQSNAAWLSLSENSAHIAPGETKLLNLTLTIPPASEAAQLTNSMLFLTQVKEQQKGLQNGLNVNVLLEVGIQVYHTPNGLVAGNLEFLAFEDRGVVSESAGHKARRMQVKIKNTGQINKDGYLRFELTNTATGEEIPIKAAAIALLPEAVQWIQVDLPAELKGHYLAVAILDAGSQYDLKIAEKEITY